ncbi:MULTISPECIES: DUF2795 domain-containing protein [Pseudonocardia]|uniref:DUF2795 domain-containing protein n=2 Tax=Pseudonocardia TaxID=1847 RepID=A0A1Y2MXT0_PSEAH|nr:MULTISPECIES: DUF2795 domain-containing protein [Pseudonocardia]OSY39607.1 hypothetical protein BG845_03204 [Pseudonocardia autotrophica]TDN72738.1 uncharacterized protein DUF2795 [Pseudonocardia autotrophica]BBG03453.1 hypothetical protein Pdca_46620 [Pseudonocardia autotrophica]GEC24873.1 hypothetical protein PSA01_19020 [Pseudonocardia saturnea]
MTTRTTTPDAVHAALDGVTFPAGKDQLTAGAERNGAGAATVEAIRAVPAETYDSAADVVAAVDTADESREETEQLRAQRRTEHTHSGLSEGTKDVDPVNPIAEELGTNRKK